MSADLSTDAWREHYSAGELLSVACPACAADEPEDRASEFGIVVAKCRRCGLTYTRTPRPDAQDHYRIGREQMLVKYGDMLAGGPHPRDANYAEHLSTIERFACGRKLVDVGSHAGFFLRRARERGWDVIGVEPSEVTSGLAREALGLDVRTGTLEDVDIEDASADAVTMIDVFEHIPNPRAVLLTALRVLKPGGILFAKVPNVAYVLAKARVFRALRLPAEDLLDAREHLVYFSPTTLRRALVDAGLEVEQLTTPLPIQSGGPARTSLRTASTRLARVLPRGTSTPLATDLAIVGRRPR